MSLLQHALKHASRGFRVFPCIENSKLPAIKAFPQKATTDPARIRAWWSKNPNFNIGISTEDLVAIDIDNKKGKNGDEEIEKLKKEGLEFPETFEQKTPSGGRHLIYKTDEPVRQGTNVLGRGVDVRARGGYVLGAGSRIEGRTYAAVDRDVRHAPRWLTERLHGVHEPRRTESESVDGRVDRVRAESRAREWLVQQSTPVSIEGAGGDQTAYQVAAKIKDMGVGQSACFSLMLGFWNGRCLPPWTPEDLLQKIENAYRYGQNDPGVDAPEIHFDPVPVDGKTPGSHFDEMSSREPTDDEVEAPETLAPIAKLNQEYAYIGGSKGFVLRETKDSEGDFSLDFIDVTTFHQNLAPLTLMFGEKPVPVSKIWMKHPDRRSYDNFCFLPGKKAPKNFYNLWRGFAVEPMAGKPTKDEAAALDAFLEHALENVCGGDDKLFHWLIGYFAHLVQRPWELPLTALVFRGKKGTGKNALIERVGFLLGSHFAVVSNRRYLTGNFNSHLENKLVLTLDEAFWSGDKAAEGVLKDLITGTHHTIERKGHEPYRTKNCIRVVILGNEDWLVPATEDERRFAVFDVGEGRLQDRKFFREMREKMEAGGYRLLLRYLLDFDLSLVDVTEIPMTKGLLEQKLKALRPFHQWWFASLSDGAIAGSDFGGMWPDKVECGRLRSAYGRYHKERNLSSRLLDERSFGRFLRECIPQAQRVTSRNEDGMTKAYRIPPLEEARKDWERFIGHEMEWEDGSEAFDT